MGFEEAIKSLDEKLRIPLIEMYMSHPLGSFDLATVPRRPLFVIRGHATFNLVWPKMERDSGG